mgnify:CR=1 FL=1
MADINLSKEKVKMPMQDAVKRGKNFSEVALGFIAFSIGNEFRLDDLKKTGKQALVIGVFQALVATLFVDIALYAVHLIMPEKSGRLLIAVTFGSSPFLTASANKVKFFISSASAISTRKLISGVMVPLYSFL